MRTFLLFFSNKHPCLLQTQNPTKQQDILASLVLYTNLLEVLDENVSPSLGDDITIKAASILSPGSLTASP